jgi:DMSO/TMAO reductase YedYZ molybdopterin-dependent catalytic subunit
MERELPPGQRQIEGFPRFGTHFQKPAPAVPDDPVIEVDGAVAKPFSMPLSDLAALPRRELTADFHCVAGWSATNLRWRGVPFKTFYRTVIEPALLPETTVTHVVFEGLDGYRSIVTIDDALGDDVLLAEQLEGRGLDSDHGAPIRLVSPSQYGFMSTKHLCRIELLSVEPAAEYHPAPVKQLGLKLVRPHPRARVWQEERHRCLPAWSVRHVYRSLIAPIKFLSAHGSRRKP